MKFENSVYNRNITPFNFKDDDFTHPDRFFLVVGEEQEVTSVESRLHTPTNNMTT
jgi:hypothetical protein